MYLGLEIGRTPEEGGKIAMFGSLGFLGQGILDVFSINVPAFRVADGPLPLVTSFAMMRMEPEDLYPETVTAQGSAPAVAMVPLAMPFHAGAGAIRAVVIFAQDEDGFSHRLLAALVVTIMAVPVYVILRSSLRAQRVFTPNVSTVFNRIMGLIVAAIAIEFIFHGIAGHFPDLRIVH